MPESAAAARRALPPWLKVKLGGGERANRIRDVSRRRGLHTVCGEARCPNAGECWGGGTATFMVMGKACTRGCRFCSVAPQARLPLPDPEEPRSLGETLAEMGLSYAVLTTVCRDDLPDQGAGHLARCIRAVKERCPETRLEILLQDFCGDEALLKIVLDAGPDVVGHNLETVRRLTPVVRDARAGYDQSLQVLRACKRLLPRSPTKSSLMLGLGETREEVLETFQNLRSSGVDFLTLGQYLRPTAANRHLKVVEFVSPNAFNDYAASARSLGFRRVASGPFVRSSYRAGELFLKGLPA